MYFHFYNDNALVFYIKISKKMTLIIRNLEHIAKEKTKEKAMKAVAKLVGNMAPDGVKHPKLVATDK